MRKIFVIVFTLGLALSLYSQRKFDINEYNAEENFKRGVFYYNETKYLSAIEFFIKSLQYKNDFHIARIWLGKAYYRAGYIENAITEWKTAIEAGAGNNILRNRLNNIFFRLGHPEKLKLIQPYVHLKTIDGNRWDSRRFVQPISIYVNDKGDIYVLSLASKSLHIFNQNGKLLKRITGGKKRFKMPFGLAIDSRRNIIISDVRTDVVHKFDKDGKPLLMFGGTGVGDGKFLGPEGIVVDKYDNIYVVDTGNARVQKFSPNGKFLMKFGEKGEKEGQFIRPSGITIDDRGFVYVSDYARKIIQKFDSYGNFIEYFPEKEFKSPRNIHIMHNTFLIADGSAGAFIFDMDRGNWLNLQRWNYNKNRFLYVSDIFLSPDNTLYISDMYKNRVEVFVPERYKYANLEVEIEHIDTAKYPRVVAYVSVYKKDGTPVVGLTRENFNVKEMGVRIVPVDIYDKIYDENKITTIFLVEKSLEMKEYEEEIKKAAGFFLKDILKTKDVVKVVNFHKVKWTGLDYDYSKLRILEALTENNYGYITDYSYPIYESIAELMNKLSRKALIFFTTGKFDIDKNFQKYEFEICKNYAKNNHTPVFIINFTKNNQNKLKNLAKATGGKYYNYFKDIKRLRNIRKDILKFPMNQYLVVYSTIKKRKLSGTWRVVDIEVNYNKLAGRDKTGYFVP